MTAPFHTAAALCLALATSAHGFEATDSYTTAQIEGWTVRFSAAYDDKPQARADMQAFMAHSLALAQAVLPLHALVPLRDVTFWIEYNPDHSAGAYHPSPEWLRDNSMNPDKGGGIELSALALVYQKDQPALVVHELSHAYEHQVIGYGNAKLAAAFAAAADMPLYQTSTHVNGWVGPAYALSNPHEYFAEASEAYFLRNDFTPFDRDALHAGDPVGFALVEDLWGVNR